MTETRCRRYLISGRVQGVFFRASTARQARTLGLTGQAVNLPDGRVEVIACGTPDQLRELERWLHQGPPTASVTDVRAEPAPVPVPDGFTTG